jgi:hypothetical protein
MNFLYTQTISCYLQLQYGKKPHDISIDILYLWTITVKELILMGIQNKKLYILFARNVTLTQVLILKYGIELKIK